MVYADNAATTKLDLDAFEEMRPFLLENYGNPSQPYFFSKEPKLAIKKARIIIAQCINAEPEQIFFTSGGTESNNWVIKGFGKPRDIKSIITSEIEHHSILNACKYLSVSGLADVEYLPVDSEGSVLRESLKAAFEKYDSSVSTGKTTMVSIMLANNEIGTIQNVKALAKIAHEHNALFHTDAVQALGHIPIDVKELNIDYLSASAHKFNGPRGIGFLYNNDKTIFPLHNGGMQEKGLRAGTENVAAIVAMAKALENNCKKMKENTILVRSLEERLINGLSDLSYIRNGSPNHIPGSISISFKGFEGEQLLHRLDLMGICVSTGSACDSVNTQTSHVLKAIGLDDEFAEGTIRISLGKNNTEEDVDSIICALRKIVLV